MNMHSDNTSLVQFSSENIHRANFYPIHCISLITMSHRVRALGKLVGILCFYHERLISEALKHLLRSLIPRAHAVTAEFYADNKRAAGNDTLPLRSVVL